MESDDLKQEPDGRIRPGALFGPASAILATALFIWPATHPDTWLGVAFGSGSSIFWLGSLLWIVITIVAIRRRQHWWVIPTAPFALWPLVISVLFYAECMRGNCI